MSMFEYDTRPATPQLVLVGTRTSNAAYAIRDFLTRNGCSYDWVDIADEQRAAALLAPADRDPTALPLCILPDGERIVRATVREVARGLGMTAPPSLSEYDVVICGAGPAGLGAAVYAASEGLSTLVVETVAPGGQAGTTSMIENYLGFPNGISGSELATRAAAQARRFGAEILVARRVTEVVPDGTGYSGRLSDGAVVRAHAVVIASGVAWRRLDVPGIDDLLGAGVYYGAGPSEALAYRDADVVVVGAGNSAGQAALRFSRYARQVTMLVRANHLEASMSQYLVDKVTHTDNIAVRCRTQVIGFGVAESGRLRELILATRGADGEQSVLPADALFVCIGGTPRIGAAARSGVATGPGGYLLTGADLAAAAATPQHWPLSRQPLPLETCLPGMFAAGDVRHNSIKRCAAAIGEGGMAVAMVHQRLAEVAA